MSGPKANTIPSETPEEGRTVFRPEYCAITRKMCELGATDTDLAEAFCVSVSRIQDWRKGFPEFSDSCRLGQETADACVERAIYQRATGYDRVIERVTLKNGSTTVVKSTHHVPADIAAAKFWLRNRKPESWRKEEDEHVDTRASNASALRDLAAQLQGNAIRPKEHS